MTDEQNVGPEKRAKPPSRICVVLFSIGVICILVSLIVYICILTPDSEGYLTHLFGSFGLCILALSVPLALIAIFREPSRRWRVIFVCCALTGTLIVIGVASIGTWDQYWSFVRLKYLIREGHANRARVFYRYTCLLNDEISRGKQVNEEKLISLMGPPDLVAGGETRKIFAYFYGIDRDCVAYVDIINSKVGKSCPCSNTFPIFINLISYFLFSKATLFTLFF